MKLLQPLALVLAAFISTGNLYGQSGTKSASEEELRNLLDQFVSTEQRKDGPTHSRLFLGPDSKMNFVLMNYGNPSLVTLKRADWIKVFTNWTYDYYAAYEDINFILAEGVAVDYHRFVGYKTGKPDIHGTDIFVFANTPSGWKIVSLTSTIFSPDDQKDYTTIELPRQKPEDVFDFVVECVNKNDKEKFISTFVGPGAPCFRLKETFTDQFQESVHSAEAFFNGFPQNIRLALKDTKIHVKDGWIATFSSSYTINDGNTLEKGRMLATLAASPSTGWKISTMIFSASK